MADVLLVSPTSRGIGGVAQHVASLADHLKRRGYRVSLISSENTPIVQVKGLKNPSFMLTSGVKALAEKAEVAHAHNLPSALAMKTSAAGRRVLTLHGVYAEQIGLLHGGLLGGAVSVLERALLRWADVLTTVSRQAAEAYRKLGFEATYIPNAVEVDGDVEPCRLGQPQVVYVGRLSKEKNVEAVLQLARRIAQATFVIVGDGPEAARLKAMSKDMNNVFFTGGVSRRKALQYIKGSDLLVLPSLAEGLSTVLLEAMALKTPVVATDVGGNTEVVQHMHTGMLVNPGDTEALAEAVSQLLHDRRHAEKLAENAYKTYLENYSWNVVVPKYLEVYGLE
ncbi:MAG: glycosyltransferase family 4 protein [Candidatus Caldarchaeum sp.]|nr:glycosyltransferase family 4 protein [Candidatus Caldarchaeum sp.]MDW8359352.1 glycosyltransferase family 4 protein [Candidatus Caldarchaeum sp.]